MRIPTLFLLLAAAMLAGCESTAFSERFATVPPQTLTVEGSKETVYYAAQKAFKRLDFVLTRTVMGRVEAASAINTSEAFADSRQIVARVVIRESEPGKCEVALALSEEVSSRSVGGTHRQDLKEHSFFGIYFAMLQQVLQEKAAEADAEKN